MSVSSSVQSVIAELARRFAAALGALAVAFGVALLVREAFDSRSAGAASWLVVMTGVVLILYSPAARALEPHQRNRLLLASLATVAAIAVLLLVVPDPYRLILAFALPIPVLSRWVVAFRLAHERSGEDVRDKPR
jgi:hypothetical protein